MYLGDTEIFRTSTAEPTATGIEWTYIEDMSSYLTLLKKPQKIIFDLGNLVDDTHTGALNTTLTAVFFADHNSPGPADVIIPISARKSAVDAASAFSVPQDNATNTMTLPRNIERAVVTISACGQAEEEFWWSNVLSSDVHTFPDTTLLGFSPFRELQLYIDGMLAGVAWPFPIIFTGGIVPGLWRPVVGIDAFDLREDEIDITPWLPLLCDGNPHTFEIRVAGIEDNGKGEGTLSPAVGNYWVVTGKIFVWLDAEGSVTTGSGPNQSNQRRSYMLTSAVEPALDGMNETLRYQVQFERYISLDSTLNTSKGSQSVSWQQSLDFYNLGSLTRQGSVQITNQQTAGVDASSSGYSKRFSYPLWVHSSFAVDPSSGNFSVNGTIDRSKNIETLGRPVLPNSLESLSPQEDSPGHTRPFIGSRLRTRQNGTATYFATKGHSFSFGTTEQNMAFAGLLQTPSSLRSQDVLAVQDASELYRRHILAVNGTVVKDVERLDGQTNQAVHTAMGAENWHDFAKMTPQEILGRGPGGLTYDRVQRLLCSYV